MRAYSRSSIFGENSAISHRSLWKEQLRSRLIQRLDSSRVQRGDNARPRTRCQSSYLLNDHEGFHHPSRVSHGYVQSSIHHLIKGSFKSFTKTKRTSCIPSNLVDHITCVFDKIIEHTYTLLCFFLYSIANPQASLYTDMKSSSVNKSGCDRNASAKARQED